MGLLIVGCVISVIFTLFDFSCTISYIGTPYSGCSYFPHVLVIVVASTQINLCLVRVKLELDGEGLNFGSFSLEVM